MKNHTDHQVEFGELETNGNSSLEFFTHGNHLDIIKQLANDINLQATEENKFISWDYKTLDVKRKIKFVKDDDGSVFLGEITEENIKDGRGV